MVATSLWFFFSTWSVLSSLSFQLEVPRFIRFSPPKEYLPVIPQAISNCVLVEAFSKLQKSLAQDLRTGGIKWQCAKRIRTIYSVLMGLGPLIQRTGGFNNRFILNSLEAEKSKVKVLLGGFHSEASSLGFHVAAVHCVLTRCVCAPAQRGRSESGAGVVSRHEQVLWCLFLIKALILSCHGPTM